MKLSILSVATFFLAAATSVTSAPLEEVVNMNRLDARQSNIQTIAVFSNTNFGGFRHTIEVTIGKCHSLPKGFRDNVKSANLFGNYRCTFYRQSDCQGSSDTNDVETQATGDGGAIKVTRPHIKKFRILVRNHARSVRCRAL
ncbi:hypothetical protein TWF102_003321 [Orbilia oligospora]|uniref:AA1-like domain-containing protein n=1 Tax=Orbilia oligospora TaxID=2813651 RepID=A0A7C8IZ77_ORBOL|nr:hypothetical protein TWF102_003321 [Orbilia oligospora]KAF3113197.1 hypothetical protein TWF103_002372 [Orbilia oligospora]KAF3147519.1 hypothetical protein TWF594_002731 [Orbilia oligospora]